MRVTHRTMQVYLQESNTPYVVVDEAAKALFGGMRLQSFNFVAYSETGPNWLITCKPFSSPGVRDTMRAWQDTFGDGFASVEARFRGGRFVLVALDGTTIELPHADIPQGFRPGGVLHHRKTVKEFDRQHALAPEETLPLFASQGA